MSELPFTSQSSTLRNRTPQIHITVLSDAAALELLEGNPQSLGIEGMPKCFRISYREAQVVVWLIGELSGTDAYDTLQQAIRFARQRLLSTEIV